VKGFAGYCQLEQPFRSRQLSKPALCLTRKIYFDAILMRLRFPLNPRSFQKTAVFAMKLQTIAAISLATITVYLSVNSPAASPKPSSASDTSADGDAYPGTSSRKAHAIPFRGVIASFDDKARTFTLAGKESARSLKITDTTVITKGGQPATMKDIVANEEVRGSYYKMSDGSLEARTVKLGPLTEAEKAEKEARKEKRDAKKNSASATP
jgi:hypothetical protein